MFDPTSVDQVLHLDLKAVFNFLYTVGAIVSAALIMLVGIAWRAGGDVREIKLAIHDHGPRIEELEKARAVDDKRITVLETRSETLPTGHARVGR